MNNANHQSNTTQLRNTIRLRLGRNDTCNRFEFRVANTLNIDPGVSIHAFGGSETQVILDVGGDIEATHTTPSVRTPLDDAALAITSGRNVEFTFGKAELNAPNGNGCITTVADTDLTFNNRITNVFAGEGSPRAIARAGETLGGKNHNFTLESDGLRSNSRPFDTQLNLQSTSYPNLHDANASDGGPPDSNRETVMTSQEDNVFLRGLLVPEGHLIISTRNSANECRTQFTPEFDVRELTMDHTSAILCLDHTALQHALM